MKPGHHAAVTEPKAFGALRRPLTGNRQLVFPSLRSRGRPISENTS